MACPTIMRQFLKYEPETGNLYWKPRARAFFNNDKAYLSFNARFAGKNAFTSQNSFGYLQGTINKAPVVAHRVAWAIVHGVFPENVDHINQVKQDNRLANLRGVSPRDNQRNRPTPSNNTSGHIGVFRSKGKWIARLGEHHLGTFASFQEAVAARKAAASLAGYHQNHGRKP